MTQTSSRKEPPLTYADYRAYDRIPRRCPPPNRPCHLLCKYNLWFQVTGAGRVQETKAYGNPNVTCMWRVIRENPDGLTCQEMADLEGYSYAHVKDLLATAMTKLRANPAARELLGEILGCEYPSEDL